MNLFTFYRATLCVSAVFAVGRCLSVRLSVCHVRVVSTWQKISSNFFLVPVAHHSIFVRCDRTQFQGEALQWGR